MHVRSAAKLSVVIGVYELAVQRLDKQPGHEQGGVTDMFQLAIPMGQR